MNREMVNINEIIRNTRRYWYVDGINEMAGGLLIFIMGGSYYLSSLIPNIGLRSIMLGFGQPLIIIGGSLLASRLVKKIKESFTYPRSGYMVFRSQKSKKVPRILLTILLAIFISVIVTFFTSMIPDYFIPLLITIFMAVLTIYLGYQNGVKRFYFIAVIKILFGVVLTYWNPDEFYRFVILFCGIGLIWIISGVIALIGYLQKTSPLPEEK